MKKSYNFLNLDYPTDIPATKTTTWTICLVLTFSSLFANFEVQTFRINTLQIKANDPLNLLERHTGASPGISNIRYANSEVCSDLSYFSFSNISNMQTSETTPAQPLQVDATQLAAINEVLASTPKIRRFNIKLYSKYVRLHGYCRKRMLVATAPTLGEAITQLQFQAASLV
jgi:hypothetical protein